MDNNNIFGRRLNRARLINGLSMEDLSRMVSPTVSRQAINKYEKGQSMPDSSMLISLSNVLGVKPDYFFRPFTVEVDKVMFRRKNSFPAKDALTIKEKVREELERYLEVEQLCGTESKTTVDKHHVSDMTDVLNAANDTRHRFGLGTDGITNVIEVLEDNGIKIIEVSEDESFEGLSGYANDSIPLIVINSRADSEHKRFTLLHELGHLVLKFADEISDREAENMCNIFASELLLPSDILISRLGKNRHDISLAELTDIQKQFGISIDSIMASLSRNEVITRRRYDGYLKKKKSYPEFRDIVEKSVSEPETTGRFIRMVYRSLADDVISLSKAAALLNTSVDNVKNQLQLV